MSENTISGLLKSRVKEYGTKLLYQRRDGWSWKQITWLDFDRKVKNIASFLMDLGLGPGDRAIVASSNRLEAISAEIAVMLVGGVIVPLEFNTTPEAVVAAANETGAKFVFVEQGEALDSIIDSAGAMPGVERIVIFPDAHIKNEKVLDFKAVLKFGLMKRKKLEDELTKIASGVGPGDPAAVFIGAGGAAAEFTQGDILEALDSIAGKYHKLGMEDQSFSYMTAASPFSKLINYLTLYKASRAAVADSRKDFYMDIVEVMPTLLYETGDDLEVISRDLVAGKNGVSPAKKLRLELGNRVGHIFTDRLPEAETNRLYREAGVTLHEITELSGKAG
jgi:long-subunit acyl-CoA synthetase (AMP-forming)